MPREIWSIQLEVTLQKALQQLSVLEARLNKIETKFKTLGASTSPAAGKNLDKLNKSTKAAGDSATAAQGKFSRFFTAIRAQGDNFVTILARRLAFMAAALIEVFAFAFALAIPAAFYKSIKAGADFEDAMLRTATVSAKGIENMEQHYTKLSLAARQMAIQVAFSATEVANAMFELASSGFDVNEIIDTMPAVINFAGAAMTDLTTSVDLMTQVMKSFGLEASDMDDVSDVLISGLNNTTLNVDRLTAAFRFAAPAGGAFRENIVDVTSVLSLFVDATKQGGIAGRAYRFMLASLANPTSEAAAIFGSLTSAIDGSRVEMLNITDEGVSAADVLSQLSLTTITTSQVLEAFGNRSGPVVALALVRLRDSYEKTGEGVEEFTNDLRKLEEILESSKAADTARLQYERFLESTSNNFRLLGAVVEEAMLQIFSAFGPVVLSFTKLMQAILSNRDNIQLFIGVAKQLAILLGALAAKWILGVIHSSRILNTILSATAAGASKVTVAIGLMSKAWQWFKANLGLFAFIAVVNIFAAIEERMNTTTRVLDFFTDRQQAAADRAKGVAREWSVWLIVVDAFTIALNMMAWAIVKVIQYSAQATAYIASWIPGMQKASEWGYELADALGFTAQGYVDNNNAIAESFGYRDRLLTQQEQEIEQQRKLIAVTAERLGLSEMEANALWTLDEATTELLASTLERIEKDEEAIIALQEGEDWALKRKAADESLNSTVRDVIRLAIQRRKELENVKAAMKAEEEAAKELAAAYKKVFPEQDKGTEGMKQMVLVLQDMAKNKIPLTEGQLLSLNDQFKEYERQIREGAIPETASVSWYMGYLQLALEAARLEMGLIIGKATEWEVATKDLPPLLKTLEEQLRDTFETKTTEEFGEAIDQLGADFRMLAAAGDLVSDGMKKEFQKRLVETAKEMMVAGEMSEELWNELALVANQFGFMLPVSIDHANRMLEQFDEKTGETTEHTKTAFEDMFDKITSGMGNAIGEMIFSATSFGEFIEDLFKGLLKMLVTQAFAGILAEFGNMLFDMGNDLDGFAGAAQDGFGSMLEGVKGLFKDFSGGTIALLGGLAVAAFGIFKALFGKDGELENVKKDLAAVGGVTDELAKKIRETARETGRWAAEAIHLRDIMDETGVTVDNFNGFVAITHRVLSALDIGQISAAEATSTLNDAFSELVTEMENLGIVGNASVIALMRDIRARGLEVASVIEYIDENMRSAADGLNTLVTASLGPLDAWTEALRELEEGNDEYILALATTEAEIGRLGRLALVVFNEMIANGSSVTEALDAIGPSLDIIRQALAATGIDGGKALRELLKWRNLVEQNRDIVDGFEALNQILTGLANVGLLTQQTFEDLLLQASQLALDLTEAGVSGRDAFVLMAPFLDNIIRLAREQGLEIDAATQALINQAEEYGVLGHSAQTEQDVMREGFDLVTRAINRLIETLGGVPIELENIGDSFDQARDQAAQAFDDIETKGRNAFKNLSNAAQLEAEHIMDAFGDVEEDLVGNTVFRNIRDKGSVFLEQLGKKALDVQGDMRFAGVDSFPNMATPTPTIITSTPTPNLSSDRRGMTAFEQQNLAILGQIVKAVLSTGRRGGGGTDDSGKGSNLRQALSEVIREATLDGDAEINVDSVGRLI